MKAAADPGVLATAQSGVITTTLYDLIETIASVVPDAWVVPTVVHVLRSGRPRFRGRADCRIVVELRGDKLPRRVWRWMKHGQAQGG